MTADPSTLYREFIDDLVHSCLRGPGQFSRQRVNEGVWHRHVESIRGDDALAAKLRTINEVLAGLDAHQREAVAELLDEQYVGAVHDVLMRLHEAEIAPFDTGYWDPHHDFYARLQGEDWPVGEGRA